MPTMTTATALTADWTDDDLERVDAICAELGGNAADLLGVAYSESGCRHDALNDNPKNLPPDRRYNAVGLVQFMPPILAGMGFRPADAPRARAEAFQKLPVGDQLPYVRQYFLPYKGRLTNVSAWYMATFLPAYIAHADEGDYVLATKGAAGFSGAVYAANAGFDADGDQRIQVRELAQAVHRNCVGARWGELMGRLDGEVTPITSVVPTNFSKINLGAWRDVQQALKLLGYYTGEVDGVWGPLSHAAVLAFQVDHPLIAADGVYGPKTRAVLQAAYDAYLAALPKAR
jgi:hypothetical protein